MRANPALVITVALIALMGTAGLLAGMDFELNYPLTAPGPGAGTGKNTLALPYVRKAGVNTSHQLMLDIGGGTIAPVASVGAFNEPTDTFRIYLCGPHG